MGARVQLKKDKEDHHPVEVVGRIRQNHPPTNTHNNGVAIQLHDRGVVRVRAESGPYRDFTLDGISWSGEALNLFYVKYIKSRIEGVKSGGKCTIILYGATGSGKSYTMFGSVKEPGIAYRALHHIMGEGDGDDKGIVKIKVVEVYNEDVYDLLGASSAKGAASPGRVRLEVRGRKVKNACSISGKRADDIVREIQTVEKRRVVKSTNCNERSSRSHCIIMVDVPSVGGQLILVDMAGSENIDQAAIGIEAKMQTGKINQGNGALKRVVEAIANGDNHIPYRDSKLTMLLQDSFEDERAKILMILCASTDPKDIYKTISTLEYGAKAKCIVKLPKSPVKEKANTNEQVILETRINVMHALIEKLQAENRLKDECREEIEKELNVKTQQLENLKGKVSHMEREKLQFIVDILKVDEKLLELIHRIENNRRIITDTEIRTFTEMQEHQAKISDFVNIVQSMEDELICKINEHKQFEGLSNETKLSQNSYCSTIKSYAISNHLTKNAKKTDVSLISRNEDASLKACNQLQGKVASAVLEDPSMDFNNANHVLSENVFEKKSDLTISHSNDSFSGTRTCEDQQAPEKIRQKGEVTKKHNLRDWDEEVQFTVVCNDSEHQAVICRSCDQIDELSSLSDTDSEVPGPSVHVCSSADLNILKEGNALVDNDDEDGMKVEISTCNDTKTVVERTPDKSPVFKNVPAISTWVQSPGENGILGVDWTSGISFTGWLPAIPETSFEGEDSETYNEGSAGDDEKTHEEMGNNEKVAVGMENITGSSKTEAKDSKFIVDNFGTDPGNTVLGISFSGWLPDIPESSFEGKEVDATYNEVSNEYDDKSNWGIENIKDIIPDMKSMVIENVKKIVPDMKSMADISKSEATDPNPVAANFGINAGNDFVNLPNDGDSCDLKLYTETGNGFHSECSIRMGDEEDQDCQSNYLHMEVNHYEQKSQDDTQSSGERERRNREYSKTENYLNSDGSLLSTFSLNNTCVKKEQGEILAIIQNLEGVNEKTTYTSSILPPQKPHFSDDDSLCFFELEGLNEETAFTSAIQSPQKPQFSDDDSLCSFELEGFNEETAITSPIQSHQRTQFSDDDSLCSFELDADFDTAANFDIVSKQCPIHNLDHTKVVELEVPPTTSFVSSENTDSPLSQPEKSQESGRDDVCNVDVYVKWGNSTEEVGKLICIVSIPKFSTLNELRKEITPHIAHVNKRFTFLMLGESGVEVDQETETELRVGSLPECSARKGCRLACLRPPRRIKLSLPPEKLAMPLSQIENQIPQATQSVHKKKGSKSSNAQTAPSPKRSRLKTMLNRDNKRKMTFKDKGRALYFQDLACTFLHGV